MSFSRNIKEEICAGGMQPSLSELIGLTHTCAGIGLAGGVSVVYSTESAALARRIFKIIKAVYGCTTELSVREDGLKKNDTYVVRLTDRNSAMAWRRGWWSTPIPPRSARPGGSIWSCC